MAEAFKIEEIEEKVILVGVSEQDGDDAEDSVAELAELVKTAGATVVGTMIQKRELIHPGTYIGSGKVAELKLLVEELGATGIVCDDELSPAQLRNLEDMLDTKVMDRHTDHSGYFCGKSNYQRGKDPGGTGTVKVPSEQADRTWTFHVKTWRRNRYERSG